MECPDNPSIRVRFAPIAVQQRQQLMEDAPGSVSNSMTLAKGKEKGFVTT
ncbi:MAG: hypothetical protein QM665_07735 [Desulfovibrio sp.]